MMKTVAQYNKDGSLFEHEFKSGPNGTQVACNYCGTAVKRLTPYGQMLASSPYKVRVMCPSCMKDDLIVVRSHRGEDINVIRAEIRSAIEKVNSGLKELAEASKKYPRLVESELAESIKPASKPKLISK